MASDELQSLLGLPGFTDDYLPEHLREELLDRAPKEWMIFNNENPVQKQVLQICPTLMDHDDEFTSVTSTRAPNLRVAR